MRAAGRRFFMMIICDFCQPMQRAPHTLYFFIIFPLPEPSFGFAADMTLGAYLQNSLMQMRRDDFFKDSDGPVAIDCL